MVIYFLFLSFYGFVCIFRIFIICEQRVLIYNCIINHLNSIKSKHKQILKNQIKAKADSNIYNQSKIIVKLF
jgi:hypothetical protein